MHYQNKKLFVFNFLTLFNVSYMTSEGMNMTK